MEGAAVVGRTTVGQRLFGVVALLCGIAVIVGLLGLFGMQRINRSFESVYRNQIVPLQRLRNIANDYAVSIIDAANKANAGLLSAEEALQTVEAARERIARHWAAYRATTLAAEELGMLAEAERLFERADGEVLRFARALTTKRGRVAGELDEFDGALYAVIDPISLKVREMAELQLRLAEAEYQRAQYDYARVRALGLGIVLVGILLGAVLGARIVRDLLRQLGGEPAYAAEIARRVAGGDLTVPIAVKRDDPSSLLSAMRNMVAQLSLMMAERRRAEERLQQQAAQLAEADRRKDEFLAMLAHELRNPLAPIANALQLIRRAGGDPALVGTALGIGERQLAQLVRLVDDLLDVSRIARGKITLRPERLALSAVIQAAVETSRPQIEAAGHQLSVELPPEPIYLEADLTRLAQALANLLINAAKYTEAGGRIRLAARSEPGSVVLEVEDTGRGISAANLPHVFELFARIEQPEGRMAPGLGVGLALVKSLVELHGGTVEASSRGLGQGSTFAIRLPRHAGAEAPGEPAGVARQPVPASGPSSRPRRILVVDDEVDVADSMAMVLETLGHVVRIAYGGSAALAAAPEFHPDFVLLDLGMPEMDGYEVARRLRQQPATRGARLIALTGWGQAADRQRTREAGFDHHLVKPVDIGMLASVLGGSGG